MNRITTLNTSSTTIAFDHWIDLLDTVAGGMTWGALYPDGPREIFPSDMNVNDWQALYRMGLTVWEGLHCMGAMTGRKTMHLYADQVDDLEGKLI